MAKLLVMTDLHLTDGMQSIIGLDPLARLRQGLAHAAKHQGDADRLLLLGDLTHYGQRVAYETLAEVMANVPWPVTYLIGNHDNRDKFKSVFPNVPVDPNGFVQSVVDLPDVRLITLDSLDDATEPYHAGRLCDKRLEWLEDVLREADRPSLIFVHHTPFLTGFDGMDDIRLLNGDAFLDLIRRYDVGHVFTGHIHRTITASLRGVPVTTFKSTCHQMPMLLGEPGSSHSIDEPGAYGIILTRGADTVAHFEDFTLPEQESRAY